MSGVSRDDVDWCYRALLGRPPESEDVVSQFVDTTTTFRQLILLFMRSPEYRRLQSLQSLLGEDIVVRKHTKYGFVFQVDLSLPNPPIKYVLHDYESIETDWIVKNLKEGDYCVDAGARHGWFTCAMAARVGRSGRVFAFDPDRSTQTFLMSLLIENRFWHTAAFGIALSDRSGHLNFHPPNFSLTANSAAAGDYAVEVALLDDILAHRKRPISLIKMDIEGYEWPALRGSRNILREDRPFLLIEINPYTAHVVGGYNVIEMVNWLVDEFGYVPMSAEGIDIPVAQLATVIASHPVQNFLFKPQ